MPSIVTVLLATTAEMLWLWVAILPVRGSTLCPEGCQCDTEEHKVSCYGPSVTAVPVIRLTDVRNFLLEDNNIPSIERDSFVTLTELNVLSVRWCGVRTIELGAFNGLTELTVLTIEGNEISKIVSGTFENLSNLEKLYLSYNGLQHLGSDVFSGLVNLNYINLEVNKLQYLHPNTFLGLPNIRVIALNNNLDLHLPTDRNFINSPTLSRLYIPKCNINSLSVKTFTNVSALETLNLGNNNLRTVDINIFTALPKLSTLYLYNNPLHCDCRLKEVWRLCEDRNIETEHVECDTPSELNGMEWGVLKGMECLEGNRECHDDCNTTRCSYTDTDTMTDTTMGTEQNGKVSCSSTKYQVAVYAVPFIFYLHGLL